jgi:acetyl-CoA carboxylase biotin carboxyl carrier protein
VSTDVKAPMVGKVLAVKVEVGQKVDEDDEIFVLEAMKMEIPIASPATGTVKEIKVAAGQSVESDAVLAVIG